MEPRRNRITSDDEALRAGARVSFTEQKEEPAPKPVVEKGFPWIKVTLAVLVAGGLAAAGTYFFYYKKINLFEEKSKLADVEMMDDTGRKNQIPESIDIPQDRDLLNAIQLYSTGYAKAARSALQDLVEKSKDDKVRSYALVYLGILADEEGKFNMALDYYTRAVKHFPKNFYAHYNMAMTYRHKGDFQAALQELELAEAINPSFADLSNFKAELEYETGNYEKAESTLRSMVDEIKDGKSYYNLGIVYKKKGDLSEAKSAFIKATELESDIKTRYKAFLQLGIIYATQGDYENAEIHFKNALQIIPNSPKAHYNLALVQFNNGRQKDAIKTLDEAVRYNSDDPSIYLYIARLYRQLGQPAKSEMLVKKALEESPHNVELLNLLSDILIEQKKWNESIAVLKKILEYSTKTLDRSNAMYNLGVAYMETGDFENSARSLELAHNLDPVNEDILLALGNMYYIKGEPHKTISLYKQALDLNPESVSVLKALGNLYYKVKMYPEAEEIMTRLLAHPMKQASDVYEANLALGRIKKDRHLYDMAIGYFEKNLLSNDKNIEYQSLIEIVDCSLKDDKPSAVIYPKIEKAIALEPNSMEARLMLAKVLLRDGSTTAQDRAEEEVRTVLSLSKDPEVLSLAYTLRGNLFYRQGFYRRSIDDYTAALEYNPANQEAFQNKVSATQKLEAEGY